jgi:hypothetical protein
MRRSRWTPRDTRQTVAPSTIKSTYDPGTDSGLRSLLEPCQPILSYCSLMSTAITCFARGGQRRLRLVWLCAAAAENARSGKKGDPPQHRGPPLGDRRGPPGRGGEKEPRGGTHGHYGSRDHYEQVVWRAIRSGDISQHSTTRCNATTRSSCLAAYACPSHWLA